MSGQNIVRSLFSQHSIGVLRPSTPLIQILRHRGGVMPHGKPRWLPVAPSKKFRLRPQDHMPQDEVDQILALKWRYHDKMSALTQYVWEDYLKNSDVGQAAIIEAQREESEHKRLIQENQVLNQTIAKKREERLKREAQEDAERIAKEVENHKIEQQKKIELANEIVEKEATEIRNCIGVEDLERAIENALQNPIDHEFAIDLQGNVYRGRYTKSIEVPAKDREKLPVPMTVAEKILAGQKVLREQKQSS